MDGVESHRLKTEQKQAVAAMPQPVFFVAYCLTFKDSVYLCNAFPCACTAVRGLEHIHKIK